MFRGMKRGLLACLLMSLNAPVLACSALLNWTAPTQNTDGSPLTDLAGYRVIYGLSPESMTQAVSLNNPSLSAYCLSGLSSGQWYFAVRAVNAAGTESADSNVVSKQVAAIAELKATVPTVYTIVKQVDRFVLLPVGTVPAGTTCVADQQVNGFNVVPRAAVSWSGNVRPDVVVAQCN